MKIIDHLYSWLSGGPGVNLLSLVLGTTGVILALVFYFRGKRIRLPVYRTRTFTLIEGSLAKIQALKILYNDQPVENLSLTRVAIWNRGSEAIRQADIAGTDKLRIQVEGEGKLLGAQIFFTTSAINNFSIMPDNERGIVDISFEYFQKNEGLVVDLYHTGTPKTKVLPKGTIIGGESLAFFLHKDLFSDAFAKLAFGWANRLFVKIKNKFLSFVFIMLILMPCAIALMPILIPLMAIDKVAAFVRRAPKHFLLE